MIDVVGLPASGPDELPGSLLRRVCEARVLLGGRRHLALIADLPGVRADQERVTWPSPLRAQLPALLEQVGVASATAGEIVALASGDPLRSGIGTTLVDLLGADAVRIHPTVSSDTLARARLGWSAESVDVVTLVGRDPDRLRRFLDPGARLVVLCSDGTTPAQVADLLCDEGLGDSPMHALWQLGAPGEGRWDATAASAPRERTDDLVVVGIEVDPVGAVRRPALGPAAGLPEEAFETDGQLTKRDVRASALSRLRPTPGGLLWDLGAGTGTIGVEWCRAADRARAIAVEQDADRAARVARNASRLGVGDRLEVVESDVLGALGRLELSEDRAAHPDAVFIGGGLSAELLEACWNRLAPGGRLVAHAVTLGSEAVLVAARDRLGGDLTRLGVEHAVPLGRHLSWTPHRAIVQLSVTRPAGADPEEIS